MRSLRILLIAAALGASASGCIYGRESAREDETARTLPPPPPPPSSDADVPAPPPAAQGDEVDEQTFRDRLSPYGHWEWVPEYGEVWVPAVSAAWRPYWYGHWVLTDWGWTFASDDPWGWAVYHYGRWGFSPAFGWYWVPGFVWGPAWVSWRVGYGWCSWAPLGPRGVVYGYASPAWIAVRQEHFTQPIVAHAVVDVRQTSTIVQRAQALPRVRPAPGAHFGPSVAAVSAASGRAIRPVSAATVVGRAPPAARGAVATPGRSGGATPRATSPGTSRSGSSASPRSGSSPSRDSARPVRGGDAPARAAPGTPRAQPSAPGGSGVNRARSGETATRSGGGAPARSYGGGGGSAPRAAPARGGASAHHGHGR
jgi:hypothetical protein